MTRLGLVAVMGFVAAELPAYAADTPVESASPTVACPATPFAMGVRF
ncbi:hypothetical protein [uncultured Salinisphaera sp.]